MIKSNQSKNISCEPFLYICSKDLESIFYIYINKFIDPFIFQLF
jgi:hypothetical protein